MTIHERQTSLLSNAGIKLAPLPKDKKLCAIKSKPQKKNKTSNKRRWHRKPSLDRKCIFQAKLEGENTSYVRVVVQKPLDGRTGSEALVNYIQKNKDWLIFPVESIIVADNTRVEYQKYLPFIAAPCTLITKNGEEIALPNARGAREFILERGDEIASSSIQSSFSEAVEPNSKAEMFSITPANNYLDIKKSKV